MQFRILGPLEVRSEGRALPLGGPKQRALLAYLLLHANEVVATDTLVDELWGERPPKTVGAYVQNCISRLRKLLGRERLETRPPGYLLRVGPEELDAARFERALEAARELEPSERASALAEALALWRGEALADLVFESFTQNEGGRLEELRLDAQEERLAAELELGHHAKVLPELEALAARHPARERLRGLEMLALHRSQRTRDALQAYQEARLALVEEYGVEPGEELRALYRAIVVGGDEAVPARVDEPRRRRRHVALLVAELLPLEDADPETERVRTATWLAEATTAVERYGGQLRQLLGEEVVAVFGLERAHEDDVLRALRAAADLRASAPDAVDRIAVDWSAALDDGADLAEAEAGPRALKEQAAPGDLLVGRAALPLVSAALDVVPHEQGGYRVLRFDAAAAPFVRHLDAPLVGRAEELRRLERAFDEAVERDSPSRIVLVGDPGIGKTRLASELCARVRTRARVLTGRCVPYGEGATFLPLAEILEQAGPLETVLAAEPDAERVAGRLRERDLSEQSESLWAVRRLLEAASRERPVVLVLEDLHWAEPTLLDLVEYLAGWARAPLLLLCVARPELLEARPEWREDALALRPLSADEARALAGGLPEAADSDRVEAAVEAAGGNPLFLEQLIAAHEEGEERSGPVPPTVEALIASRLDRLPSGERAVLERAAVAGREFWRSAVDELTPEDEQGAAGAALMALVRRRLVRPEPAGRPGEDGFRFHHVLIRDVAYDAVPTATRAELHERLGRWLDGRGPELDELVGYHLERAALLRAELGEESAALAEEAGHRLGEAGMGALKRADARAAVNLLTRAIALLADGDGRLEFEWALGTAVKFTGDPVRADALLDEVVERARQRRDRRIELRARIEQGWPRLAQGAATPEETLELIREASGVFAAESDDLGAARALHLEAAVRGVCLLDHGSAAAAARQLLGYHGKTGFTPGRVGALSILAVSACRGRTPVPEAISICQGLLEDAATPVWQSFVLPSLALLEAMAGDFERARVDLAAARELREEFADTATIVTSWSEVAGEVELLAGEPSQAEAILVPACEALRAAGDAGWYATNAALLAESVYHQGRLAEALSVAQEALAAAPAHHLTSRTMANRALARALAQLGRAEQAETVARETVARLQGTDALDEYASALTSLGDVLTAGGASAEAVEVFRKALDVLEAKGNVAAFRRLSARIPALA
jgi:DNA-binding SARP family transcriptional activator/predicted negative regulator of RcsB-dependent stress response